MPRSRRLTGRDLVRQLEQRFGFTIWRIRGSHHTLRRVVIIKSENGEEHTTYQTVIVPVHGNKSLGPGLLKQIYRQLLVYIGEDELRDIFYTE